MLFRYLRLMACFIVGARCRCVVHAQTARISGQVLDPQGAVVPKAPIQIINQETKVKLEATSDDNGHYTVAYLPAANYQVLVHIEGFSDFNTYVALGWVRLWNSTSSFRAAI
jgi:predicted aspartyl protease